MLSVRNIRAAIFASIAVTSVHSLVFGQPAQNRLSFEVASVKANLVEDPLTDYAPQRSGSRITMHNSELSAVIAWAYHLTNRNYQLVAGHWERNLWDSYDIEALAPGSPGDADLRLMFQTLLEDRFDLRVRWETRELPAYDLVVARSGSKLSPAPPGTAKVAMGSGGSSSWVEITRNGGRRLVGKGASMEELAVVLTGKMNAPVRDRTGLAGAFDYNVAFSSGLDVSDAPVLTTAIHDLGLNLVKSKGEFDVLVIDQLGKLSEN